MARKLVVAAIGGNHVDKAAELAKQFGEEFTAKRGWILMTGGKPKESESKVKDAALFGCKKAHGLMVSILPKKKGEPGKVHCKPIIGERRVELVTDLTNYGRDPITGAAADIVVVFDGADGTLVELAYAALKNRPIVFLSSSISSSRTSLRDRAQSQSNREKVIKKLTEANEAYGSLIPTSEDNLMAALDSCLQDNRFPEVNSISQAITQINQLSQHIKLYGDTHFRGMPGDAKIKGRFEKLILDLSKLAPNDTFREPGA
jgi:uncharacterized protein (TIGR00725 family)